MSEPVRIKLESVAHHLTIAAEHYARNAATCREETRSAKCGTAQALARIFDEQEAECRAWARALDAAERITLEPTGGAFDAPVLVAEVAHG